MHPNKYALLLLLLSVLPACRDIRAQVAFSQGGGFYENTFPLTLTATADSLAIHYTTDGSVPTVESPIYTQPLLLSSQLYSTSNLFQIRDCPAGDWNPPSEVEHAIVLRARAFAPNGEPVGTVATNTYLVSQLMRRTPTLPVLSIALSPEALFNPDSGIFSPNGWSEEDDFNSGNFNQHGRKWERVAHMEFFDPQGSTLSTTVGIRVHGQKTRRNVQKPLKLYARRDYGDKRMRYPFFSNREYTSYKRLVLKPFSAAWTDAGIAEQLAQDMAEDLGFLSLATRPITLYINGEYWGIYFLQEATDEHTIEQRYGVDDSEVNLIGDWNGNIENGDNQSFLELMRWLESISLADSANLADLYRKVDIGNFIDYQLFEAFIANVDWPANNMRCFSFRNVPWRWIFFDADAAFRHTNRELDMTGCMTYTGSDTWPSSTAATLLFRKLLQSDTFAEQLGRRMYQLASKFSYSNTKPILNQVVDAVGPEIAYQARRFGTPSSKLKWYTEANRINQFLESRPENFLQQMEKLIAVSSDAVKHFRVYPNPAKGEVFLQIEASAWGWEKCDVYTIEGQFVAALPIFLTSHEGIYRMPIESLPVGTYLLVLHHTTKPTRLIVH